jgi:hypothetical protein
VKRPAIFRFTSGCAQPRLTFDCYSVSRPCLGEAMGNQSGKRERVAPRDASGLLVKEGFR